MVTINLTYTGDLHCEATHGPSGTTLATDAPKDNQGKGESFSPTDLVATALGSCILTVMGITARKLGVAMEGARVSVEKQMQNTPVRRIAALKAAVQMPAGIAEEHHAALAHAAHSCPVHQSLHPEIDAPIEISWG